MAQLYENERAILVSIRRKHGAGSLLAAIGAANTDPSWVKSALRRWPVTAGPAPAVNPPPGQRVCQARAVTHRVTHEWCRQRTERMLCLMTEVRPLH